MIGSGFGGATSGNDDFEALSRQYWAAWGEALRSGGVSHASGAAGMDWQQALRGWQQFLPEMPSEMRDAVARFQMGSGGWYAQMQQLAAQFAGQSASPSDIASAWRAALESSGGAGNPFAVLMQASPFNGQQSFDAWLEQVMPYLQALQGVSVGDPARWLQMPSFGLAREHQERWQQLLKALHEYQQRNSDYQAAMGQVLQRAYGVFERRLGEHQGPGRQLASARGLFDVWIDAAEEAYAEAALSQAFGELQGTLTNAQMRLRQSVQVEVEKVCGLFGMPTRSEIDSAHRKIAQLERSLRELTRQSRASAPATSRKAPAEAPNKARAAKSVGKAKSKPKAATKPVVKATNAKPVTRKAAPKRAATVTPSKQAARKAKGTRK